MIQYLAVCQVFKLSGTCSNYLIYSLILLIYDLLRTFMLFNRSLGFLLLLNSHAHIINKKINELL